MTPNMTPSMTMRQAANALERGGVGVWEKLDPSGVVVGRRVFEPGSPTRGYLVFGWRHPGTAQAVPFLEGKGATPQFLARASAILASAILEAAPAAPARRVSRYAAGCADCRRMRRQCAQCAHDDI